MNSRERGVTLIEVLASSSILLVVLLAAYSVIDASQRIGIHQNEIADMDAAGRLALDLMAADIRETGRDPARLVPTMRSPVNAGFVGVRSDAMMGRSIDIRADFNGDGSLLQQNEHVRYEWKDPIVNGLATLVRVVDSDGDGVLDAESMLAENVKRTVVGGVQQPILQYLDANGTAITSRALVPAAVRTVRIQFTVQTSKRDRVSRRYREIVMSQTVVLRNLRSYP